MAPPKVQVKITTSFTQPLADKENITGETISFNRNVTIEEIIEHLVYVTQGSGRRYFQYDESEENTLIVPATNGINFKFKFENNVLTCISQGSNNHVGGQFVWEETRIMQRTFEYNDELE